MNRGIGIAVIVIGLLILFAGLFWAWRSYQDEAKNNDKPGPITNPDRSNDNAGNAMNGFWLAGGGLLVTVVGVVLTAQSRPTSA